MKVHCPCSRKNRETSVAGRVRLKMPAFDWAEFVTGVHIIGGVRLVALSKLNIEAAPGHFKVNAAGVTFISRRGLAGGVADSAPSSSRRYSNNSDCWWLVR